MCNIFLFNLFKIHKSQKRKILKTHEEVNSFLFCYILYFFCWNYFIELNVVLYLYNQHYISIGRFFINIEFSSLIIYLLFIIDYSLINMKYRQQGSEANRYLYMINKIVLFDSETVNIIFFKNSTLKYRRGDTNWIRDSNPWHKMLI